MGRLRNRNTTIRAGQSWVAKKEITAHAATNTTQP
jgi:hypothetical protein